MSKRINQASKSHPPRRKSAAQPARPKQTLAAPVPSHRRSLEDEAARTLRRSSANTPTLAIILGSGFQGVCDTLEVEQEHSFEKVPGFRRPTVGGHAGKVVRGHLGGIAIWMLSGRVHYYEGCTMGEVTFAVRVLARLGVRDLVLTNAAGGINPDYRPGDFMVLRDHINMMGCNPLRGEGAEQRRFVDLSAVYDPSLADLAWRAGRKAGARMHRGVYMAVSGPSYETPAEITAFGRLGADAVGMSTVPEAITARQLNLRVVGISCITNVAAGLSDKGLSHEDVLARGGAAKGTAADLLRNFVSSYGQSE